MLVPLKWNFHPCGTSWLVTEICITMQWVYTCSKYYLLTVSFIRLLAIVQASKLVTHGNKKSLSVDVAHAMLVWELWS